MDITIIKWTKIWTKIIELFDLVNDYSTPEELIKQLDNKYSNDERLQLLAYLNGYIDHKKVIDLLVDSFYARDGKNCLRKDRSLYLVLSCFIVYFHDEDNHFDLLNSIDNSSYKERFVKFLKYLLNEKNLLTYIKYTWLTLYNDDYVDANLIKPILNNIQKYDRFTNEEREMFSVNETKSKSATIPVPFNFIGNKARKILLPEPLAQHDFEPKFSKTKKAKRRSISANFNSLEYYDNPKKKKEKKAFLKQSVNRSEPSPNEENTFSKERQFKATPFTFKKNTIPVKLNTALILKEENLVREKIQKFCEQWGDEEREIKNANNYWEWRREVRSEELKNELDRLDALRMMSKQSFEGAITARNNLVFYRREQARLIELEENELCRLGDEKARLLLKARQEAANSSRELRENCRVAKEKIFTARRINANQISDLSKQFENKALKKAEQDMKNRIDLIQAIKSSESASMGRQKLVDLGKPGGHGLLSEMSLTELKERVELMRQEVDWARKEKHDQIIREKREWDSARLEKLQYVNSSRQGLNLPDNEIITNMSLKEVLNNHKQSSNLNQQQSIKPMNVLDERLNSIDVARRHQQYLFYSHYRDFLEKKRLEDMERHYEKTSSVLYQKSL